MEQDNVFGKILSFFGGLINTSVDEDEGKASANLPIPSLGGIKLPEAVSEAEYGDIIALLKGFLSSGDVRIVSVSTRNHLSAIVTEVEQSRATDGWGKIRTIIADKNMEELIQPLLAFTFKNQERYASVIKVFSGM